MGDTSRERFRVELLQSFFDLPSSAQAGSRPISTPQPPSISPTLDYYVQNLKTMVKFHESSFVHDYPFPTVSLAYFLRYPNPYASHVLSTDVIESHFDPVTQRLYTARLHLKRSKIPSAILALIPRRWLGASSEGSTQSYILERSIVDVKDGVMITESRNLDFTAVLSVVERQLYKKPAVDLKEYFRQYVPRPGFRLLPPNYEHLRRTEATDYTSQTDVLTKVELHSRLGEGGRRLLRGMTKTETDSDEETEPVKTGFFASLSRGSIQRSIEAIGLRRAERAVPNSKKGMNVVLDRLRSGGLVAVLEGMRRDREIALGTPEGPFRNVYRAGPEEEV